MTDARKIRERSKKNASAVLAFKARLVKQRTDHGLSQQDVADRLGVKQSTVAELERYDSNPTLRTIQRYANAVDAKIRFYVDDDCVADPNTSFREIFTESTTAPSRWFEDQAPVARSVQRGWRKATQSV